MEGVVKLAPVPKLVPPLDAANQFNVPLQPPPPSTTVPVPHRVAPVVEGLVGMALIVATTVVRELSQPLTEHAK